MNGFYFILLIYLCNFFLIKASQRFDISKLKISSQTDQIMIVFPQSYHSYKASFYYYIKKNNIWEEFLVSQAAIGKDGLGLESEYDAKTPVGAFRFNKYFGIEDNPGTKLPYIKLNESLYWNSDSLSTKYNQMVNIETYSEFNKDISEHLIEYTLPYRYAMSINYNEEAIPYKGSAIFLHCFSNYPYTSGCVAVPLYNMIKIFKKVNRNAIIIIDLEDNIYNY